MIRPSGRHTDQLRDLSLTTDVAKYAEGSCLIKLGHTHVMCTASVVEKVPSFLKNKGSGWITAEYGMLPRSTHTRTDREAVRGKQTGRTQEIQRLIGRSLRCISDLTLLGERQIHIDCDVLQADGGTRTASITASYVALVCALKKLLREGVIQKFPITDSIAAVSCGLFEGVPILDPDYEEDSVVHADTNFVLTGKGTIVEIQSTSETHPIAEKDFSSMFALAKKGIENLIHNQQKVLEEAGFL